MIDKEKYIKRISCLIARELRGELTEREQEELEQWKGKSSLNEQLYKKLTAQEGLSADYRRYHRAKDEEGWQQILRQIKPRKTRKWSFFLRYAAIVVVAFSAIYWLRQNNKVEKPVVVETVKSEIIPGTSRAILRLAGDKRISLDNNEQVNTELLKQYGIRLEDSVLSYSEAAAADEFHILEVPRGGEYILLLEDGSKIWINAESVLKYPVRFAGQQRKVFLEHGEAYFRVASDTSRPFYVETAGLDIQVTGTEFNVMAYQEKTYVETTLTKGRVQILSGQQSTHLIPGEQAIFSKENGRLNKRQVDVNYYTSWKEGIFEFNDMPLSDVAEQLGRWYDVEFFFRSEQVKNIRFTGAIQRSKSLKFILDIIRDTRTIDYQIDGRTILVYKK